MIKVGKVFKIGDLVHCTSLSQHNVEKLILGERYRVVAIDYLHGTALYTLRCGDGSLVHTTGQFIDYITKEVNYPIGTKGDVINPSHYADGGIETIDYLKAKMSPEEFQGFLRGNVLKYMSRVGKKDDPIQELEKAGWYLQRLISELKSENTTTDETVKLGDTPMTKRQQQFIAGLCDRHGIDRTDLPSYLSAVPDYHYLTEAQATKLIERLLNM